MKPELITDCRAPGEIEARSLAIIDSEVPQPRPFQGAQWEIVRRMIHTSADFELLDLVRFHPLAVRAGLDALARGCNIITDTEMARMGIPERRLIPLGCERICLMNDPGVAAQAAAQETTRARAAVEAGAKFWEGAVMVVGNAPTALIRMLELLQSPGPGPALIVGMPVGFVNAAESKELLTAQDRIPYVTIKGRKGGSPLAASVVNALAEMALKPRGKTS